VLERLPASDVPERVRHLRARLGLTQTGLAEALGVSAASVLRWEHGRTHPSELAWQRILRAERDGALVSPVGPVARFGGVPDDSEPAPPRTNLPAPLTSFVGREAELSEILALLGSARLLTLTGAGGSGKTRLALEVGYRVSGVGRRDGAQPDGRFAVSNSHGDTAAPQSSLSGSHSSPASAALGSQSTLGPPTADTRQPTHAFPDGVWLAELAPLTDPALVPWAIGAGLGVREQPGRPLVETLTGFLRGKRLLLVVDNFEHVLAAAPLLTELLRSSPELHLLVTSRVLLRLSGEQSYAVPPLRLPDPKRLSEIEDTRRSEAVQLFCERARTADVGIVMTEPTARTVAEICARLDGLPLAVELAAARLRVLSPGTLLTRLQSPLHLLTGGPRDASSRQQTLRSTILWSHELLGDAEKVLFRRLAVFAGGCTLEGAEALCASTDRAWLDVVEGLDSLCDSSLLQQRVQENGELRFVMLETLREFGLERLAESGEEAKVRRRHRDYFVRFAEQAAPHLMSGAREPWHRRLTAEHANLVLALQNAVDRSDPESGLRLVGAATWWAVREAPSEMLHWAERLLELAGPSHRTAARARVLWVAAALSWMHEDVARTRVRLAESTALWRELGEKQGLALALAWITWTAPADLNAAQAQIDESIALYRELGDPWGLAWALHSRGMLAAAAGDLTTARSFSEESLQLYGELGDTWFAAYPMMNLAQVALRQRDYATANRLFEQVLPALRSAGEKTNIASTLTTLGYFALRRGEAPAAAVLLMESLELRRELNAQRGIAGAFAGIAGAASLNSRPIEAARLLGAAAALRDEFGADPRSDLLAPLREEIAAGVRARLDARAFAAAFAEGRALPLEGATSAAFRELEAVREAGASNPPFGGNPGQRATASGVGGEKAASFPDRLSSREVEVLRLLAAGRTNQEVAGALVLSVHTVERHVATIYRKIGAHGKATAATYALAHGLLETT
jgi:predicted ATPase/DNA-binding CsgD family transcriptional regulator/DNA-binding XRE family transcriptional regulator